MFNCWTLAARTFRMRRRSKCARAAERASSRVTTVRSPLRCSPRQTFNPILIGGAKSSGPGQTVLKAVAASAALAGFRAWTSALGCVSSIGRNLAFGGHRQVCLVICCRCGAPSSNQLIGHRLHFPGKSFAVLPKEADRIHPPVSNMESERSISAMRSWQYSNTLVSISNSSNPSSSDN